MSKLSLFGIVLLASVVGALIGGSMLKVVSTGNPQYFYTHADERKQVLAECSENQYRSRETCLSAMEAEQMVAMDGRLKSADLSAFWKKP